jgi:DNA-binding MarR family transcriptional regulator
VPFCALIYGACPTVDFASQACDAERVILSEAKDLADRGETAAVVVRDGPRERDCSDEILRFAQDDDAGAVSRHSRALTWRREPAHHAARMVQQVANKPPAPADDPDYRLEEQVGFLLRRAHQRHTAIFAAMIGPHQLTPTQFASLAKIYDEGTVSQNKLGRLTAMDPATMQGVIARLLDRGFILRDPDPEDRRRALLSLTDAGRAAFLEAAANGKLISKETLAPLDAKERAAFLRLLAKLV